MKILLTGPTGFLGQAILGRLLADQKATVRAAIRQASARIPEGAETVAVGDLGGSTDWSAAVQGMDTVIHTAARVHVMREAATDPLTEFRRVNVAGTLRLARQAAAAGVRRLIFISSIKVNGENTKPGHPFTADDTAAPVDPYGISKHEAEIGLKQIASETGLEVVIIRPPLVYGAGVKANFLSMMRWLYRGIPLPLGSVRNSRSLVARDNLVDLIITCIDHPGAANQTFLAADGEDLSTTDLLRRMGTALGRPARLLPVPSVVLARGAALLGKQAVAQRLLGSLQVDIDKTRRLLGWTPPVSVDEALRTTARDFLESHVR